MTDFRTEPLPIRMAMCISPAPLIAPQLTFIAAAVPDANGGIFFCGRFRGMMDMGGILLTSQRNRTFLAHIDQAGNVSWAKQAVSTTVSTVSRADAMALSANGN